MQYPRWLAGAGLFVSMLTAVQAEAVEFYIGKDGRETVASGTYAGLDNPNYNRLQFLFAHWNEATPASNHYHGIGSYSHVGPNLGAATAVEPTNANNRIPETYTGQLPLTLNPGTGLYAGKLVSGTTAEHYSNLDVRSVQSLAPFDPLSPEGIMFHSSTDRWSGSLAGTAVGLRLVSVSPGLHVGTASAADIFTAPGEIYALGDGNTLEFTPVFWVDGLATPGAYSAEFKLVDMAGPLLESGTFNFDFRVVPEPASMLLMTGGALTLVRRRR